MITIDFDREAEHASFCGKRTHGVNAIFDMARLLTDEGWSDVPAVFVDERGMRCMTVRSIYACARVYRPTEDQKAAKAEQIAKAKREKVAA